MNGILFTETSLADAFSQRKSSPAWFAQLKSSPSNQASWVDSTPIERQRRFRKISKDCDSILELYKAVSEVLILRAKAMEEVKKQTEQMWPATRPF